MHRRIRSVASERACKLSALYHEASNSAISYVTGPFTHLDPGLTKPQLLTELLPHESVRVVSLVKQPLQTIELLQTKTSVIIILCLSAL